MTLGPQYAGKKKAPRRGPGTLGSGAAGARAGEWQALERRLLEEYREIGINFRYWGDVRWRQFNSFLLANGALSAGAFAHKGDECVHQLVVLAIAAAGITAAAVFFFLEERSTYYRRAFVRRAATIEVLLAATNLDGDPLYELSQFRATKNSAWKRSSPTAFRHVFMLAGGIWGACAAYVFEPYGWVVGACAFVMAFALGRAKAEQLESALKAPMPHVLSPQAIDESSHRSDEKAIQLREPGKEE